MTELSDEIILAVVALEKQYGDGHHSFELRESIYDLLSSSQARLSEAVKVLKPLVQYLEDAGPILASDIDMLVKAKAFLAILGEAND